MDNNQSVLQIITSNILLIILWNMIILIISIKLDKKSLNPNKNIFNDKKWEKNGLFYTKFLHIKAWKDHLPQYVSKDGFSKRNLVKFSQLSEEYIEEFIFETCRAEWNHLMCCFFPIIAFTINSLGYAIIFSVISIITNVPFICIQRYNRIRLKKLLHRKSHLCNRTN